MGSNFATSVGGPTFIRKGVLRRDYPDVKPLHGQYGAMMSEAQMHDSRMNLNSLFTAAVDGYHPGQTGATLGNYIEVK